MNIQEAFDTLGLNNTATKSEIKEKHRSLIKEDHTDKENGNHEKSSLINNARDITLKYMDEKMNLTLIKQVVDIVTIDNNRNLKKTEYKAQSDSLHNRISRKIGSRYKNYRSMAKTFGLISASIALLSSKLLPLIPNESKDPNLTITFAVFAAITGLSYLIINATAERIQNSIDDLKDTLSDKGSYYEILNSILRFQEPKTQSISRSEFEELCEKWFHLSRRDLRSDINRTLAEDLEFANYSITNTIKKIGIQDFVKFLISKGLEKNILIEKEYFKKDLIEIKYEINQKASA